MSSYFSSFTSLFKKENIKYPNLHKLLDNMNTSDELIKTELVDLNTLELTKLYDEFKTLLSKKIKIIDERTKQEQLTQSPSQNGGSKKKHLKKSKKTLKKSKHNK
jgi:hypothetical protein